MSQDFFERHQPMLQKALEAAAQRGYWSPFPESPSPRNYGETAAQDGQAAFEALRGKPFALDLPQASGAVGARSRRSASNWVLPIRRSRPKRWSRHRPRPWSNGAGLGRAPGWACRWRSSSA